MNIEKVFKREDGSQVKVCVSTFSNSLGNVSYSVDLWVKGFRKVKWQKGIDTDSYDHRKIPFQERHIDVYRQILLLVSEQELYELKLELWQLLKPVAPLSMGLIT